MHTRKVFSWPCFVLTAGLMLCLPETARAWKPYTHNFIGDKARLDAIDDGQVTINGRQYTLPQAVVDALRNWPAYYDAGVTGDALPELVYSQTLLHPNWTGEWLRHLLNSAREAQNDSSYTANDKSQILAFTYGFLTHAAGDVWGHTLMNDFANGVFPALSDIYGGSTIANSVKTASKAYKHMIVEAYIQDAAPGWDGNRELRKPAPKDDLNDDISDDSTPGHAYAFPHRFIYRTLIDPDVATPWDVDDLSPQLKPAGAGNYTKARGLLAGGFLELKYRLTDYVSSSPPTLQEVLANYSATVDAFNALSDDCDFEDWSDLWNCPTGLLELGYEVVIDSYEAAVDLFEDATYELKLEVLDAYLHAWILHIDDGLQHWGEFGEAMTKALFDPQTRRHVQNKNCAYLGDDASFARATCESDLKLPGVLWEECQDFVNDHMLRMIGLPDGLVDFIGEVSAVIESMGDDFKDILTDLNLPLDPLWFGKEALGDFLKDKINDAIEDATGVDLEALHEILKRPAHMLCLESYDVTSRFGTLTLPLFKPGDRERLDRMLGFTDSDHEGGLGCNRLRDDVEFDPDNFGPIRNSITLAKLLLLDGLELNHVLSDILCRNVTPYQAGQNVMIDDLPTLPGRDSVSWLQLIDGDHAWRANGLPRFIDDDDTSALPTLYPWNWPTPRPKKFNGGSGRFPLWESCELRPAFRVLFKDWENGNDNFPDLGDKVSGVCPCFEVNRLTVYCQPDSFPIDWVLKNNSPDDISWVAVSALPTNATANPSLFQLQNPLTSGQEVHLSTVISNLSMTGSGSLPFTVTVGNNVGSLPCSKALCAQMFDCCFMITQEQMDPVPGAINTFAYSFTFTSQANVPIKKIVFKALDAGFTVSPTEIVFDPPLFPGSSRAVNGISIQVDSGRTSQHLCCKVSAYDANGFKNCNRTHCIPYHPLIALGGPNDGSHFLAPASFQISAVVAPTVTPTQVGFYLNDALVFTTNAPPYSSTLTGITSGVYALVGAVSDASGAIYYSQTSFITVTQAPSIFITNQPQNHMVTAGSNVTFAVGATGLPPLFYQWSSDGFELAGATNASVTLTNLQAGDSGRYCVRIGNGGGVVLSTNAYLTVNDPPSLTFQPRSQTNLPGGAVTFKVTAAGTPPLGYVWKFNGTVIPDATNPNLALTNLQPGQAGDYMVVVSNVAGTATSTNATLTIGPDVPRILTGPASQIVTSGGAVTFTVSAAGALPLGYQWRFNGTNLAGATSTSFSLPNGYETNTGYYGVIVSNVFGTNSAAARLTVLSPYVIWFEDFNYPDGQIVVTSTNLAGTTTNWVRHSGTSNDAFVINKRLQVANFRGDDVNRKFPAAFTTSPTNLYACFIVSCTNAPSMTNFFAHFIVGNAVLHGRAFNAPGSLPNTWKLGITTASGTVGLVKFLPVDLATNTDYQVVIQWDASAGLSAVAGIWVNPVSASDPGAVASDTISPAPAASLGFGFRQASGGSATLLNIRSLAVGTTFEAAATSVWQTNALSPRIVYAPKGGTNYQPNSVLLSGVAAGQGLVNMTYTWLKNGDRYVNPDGNTNTLYFPSAMVADSGAYQLVATTPYGLSATSAVANLWITNEIPPIFTAQPTSTTVLFGQTATFNAAAIGPGTITYQWNHFGTNLPGETGPSLNIPNVQANNGTTGAYTIGVSNEYGGILSSEAVLSAIPIPTASIAFLRTLVDTNYLATNSTAIWQVTGTVTTFTNLTTGNTSSYYLQDGTAGIQIFARDSTFRPALGDVVTFVGVLSSFNSTLELLADIANNPVASHIVLSNNIAGLPAPRVIPFNLTNNLPQIEALEGSIVMLTNVFFGTNAGNIISITANTTVAVTNAAGETFKVLFAFVDQDTAGQILPSFAWTVRGALAQNLGNAVSPRNQLYNVTVTKFADVVTNRPPALHIRWQGSGHLTWTAVPYDYSYTVLAASAVTGPYVPIASGLTFTTTAGTCTDTNASGATKYYKISSP